MNKLLRLRIYGASLKWQSVEYSCYLSYVYLVVSAHIDLLYCSLVFITLLTDLSDASLCGTRMLHDE
jgi:hypothetical protein